MTEIKARTLICVRLFAILVIALIVAYVFTGFLCINRMAWIAAHQGWYYTSYWFSTAFASFLLFVAVFAYIRRGFTQAGVAGIVVGYLASCAAGITMYFQRGVGGPAMMLRHEAANHGLVSVFVTHFVVVLIAGGPHLRIPR